MVNHISSTELLARAEIDRVLTSKVWSKGQQLKPIPGNVWPWLYATKNGDKHMCAPSNAKVTLLENVGPRKVCRALYNGREVRTHSYEWCLRESVWKRFVMFVKDELGY